MHTFPPLFETAVAFVLAHEGGYVDDPDDRGGETKFGISKRSYPHLAIAELTADHAKAIYYHDYWLAAACDRYASPRIALFVFDAAVQHGVRAAVRNLQRQLGVTIDGVVGPITLAAERGCVDRCEVDDLLARLAAERAAFYANIVLSDASQHRFLLGWMRRLFDLWVQVI